MAKLIALTKERKLTMKEIMLGKLVTKLMTIPDEFSGVLVDLFEKLAGPEARNWFDELKKFLRKEKCWINQFVRTVKVDQKRTPFEAIQATGRREYINNDVVAKMPKGGKNEELIFFLPEAWEYTRPGFMSDDDAEKAYERRGLKPASGYSIAKANEDDPTLADEKPNCTHWKDEYGKWHYLAFYRLIGCSWDVGHDHLGHGWNSRWWFAGVRITPQDKK